MWKCSDCGVTVVTDDRPGLGECPTCDAVLVEPGAARVAFPRSGGDGKIEVLGLDDAFLRAYRLKRVLGTGGAGAVYQATQLSTNRRVAIKFVSGPERQDVVARLEREGRVLARLDHPAILGIYDVGRTGDHPFVVLELATGGNLRTLLEREQRLAPARLLEILAPCLDALALCHEQGVVHRDLKLENVLLVEGEQARLADFGLARATWDASSLTAPGTLIGTPATLAPEVLVGDPARPASDIYALGVMMYELLTGRYPFEYSTLNDLLAHHASTAPPTLRRAVPDLALELDALVRRCMAKAPADRPESARALSAALSKIVTGEVARRAPGPSVTPVNIQRPPPANSPLERTGAPGTRRRGIVLALGAAVLAACAVLAKMDRTPPPPPSRARSVAPPLAASTAPGASASPSPAGRIAAALASRDGLHLGSRWLVDAIPGAVGLSADARLLASSGDGSRTGVTVWDLTNRQVRMIVPPPRPGNGARQLAFSPDARRLAILDGDGKVSTVDVPDAPVSAVPTRTQAGHVPIELDTDMTFIPESNAVGWLPDGRVAAIGCTSAGIFVLHGDGPPRPLPLQGATPPYRCRLYGPRDRIAAVDGIGTLRVWQASTLQPLQRVVRAIDSGRAWAYSPSAGLLARVRLQTDSVIPSDALEVVDLAGNDVVAHWSSTVARPEICHSVNFVDNDTAVLVGFAFLGNNRYEWRDIAHPDRKAPYVDLIEFPVPFDITPDGHRIAFGMYSQPITVFSRPPPGGAMLEGPESGHVGPVQSIAWLPDGSLVTGADDRHVRIWNLATGTVSYPPVHAKLPVKKLTVKDATHIVATGPDGRFATLAFEAGRWRLKNVEVNGPRPPVPSAEPGCPPGTYLSARSPDGRWIAAGNLAGAVSIRDARDAQAAWRELGQAGASISTLAFDPASRLVVAGAGHGDLRVWSLPGR